MSPFSSVPPNHSMFRNFGNISKSTHSWWMLDVPPCSASTLGWKRLDCHLLRFQRGVPTIVEAVCDSLEVMRAPSHEHYNRVKG